MTASSLLRDRFLTEACPGWQIAPLGPTTGRGSHPFIEYRSHHPGAPSEVSPALPHGFRHRRIEMSQRDATRVRSGEIPRGPKRATSRFEWGAGKPGRRRHLVVVGGERWGYDHREELLQRAISHAGMGSSAEVA